MPLKHASRGARFEHNLRYLNRVALWDICLEMGMAAAETKGSKYEAAPLEFAKGCRAGIDVRLLLEAVIPALGHEHERYPIVPRVLLLAERFIVPTRQNFFHISFSLGEALLARPWNCSENGYFECFYSGRSPAGHRALRPRSTLGRSIDNSVRCMTRFI